VQVHYGEGIATHTGPKPCVVPREGWRSVAGSTGQPLSREILDVPGPTLFSLRKATQTGALMQAPECPAWSKPWHVWSSLNGNRTSYQSSRVNLAGGNPQAGQVTELPTNEK